MKDCKGKFGVISGNSIDIDVQGCESEIRADIIVSAYNSIRLWGRVIDCNGDGVENALIKLVKVECTSHGKEYHGIAHTISDCEGFYQFEVCADLESIENNCYKLLISKAAYGPERIIPTSGGTCNPCDNSDGYPFDPCREYPSTIRPSKDCCSKKNNCSKSKY